MKYLRIIAALLLLSTLAAFSCDKSKGQDSGGDDKKTEEFDVQLSIPASLEVSKSDRTCTLAVLNSKAPAATDQLTFTDALGISYYGTLSEISTSSVKVTLANGIVDGEYTVNIKRGDRKKTLGKTTVKFISKIDFEPAASSTVYGVVSCNGTGIADVVVSDGYEVVKTNANGIYEMASKKEHGYVFISVPSGYEVAKTGILPNFWVTLGKGATELERADFELTKVSGQDNHTMLMIGDIHLANRTSDRSQFSRFTDDVNKYVSANSGAKIYGLTLGDMTWDLYWYSNKYCFDEYLADANAIDNLEIFHTIGNHDHDMQAAGDFSTVVRYKKALGPTYYSFNIGKVHYVVLDNIECTNDGSGTSESRTYNCSLVTEDLEWLEKDLKYVPKTTPLVVTMHAPLYTEAGAFKTTHGDQFLSMVSGYNVQLFTGHTHLMYNVDKQSSNKIFEHNAGAVCATWWWSGNETPGIHISQDGTPGGYTILTVSGTDFKWQYKATASPVTYQFRTYDRNEINLDPSVYTPSATGDYLKEFNTLVSGYGPNSDNYVYINVWDYDPSWTIEVKEGDTTLPVSKVTAKDPLHLVAYSAQRLNKNKTASFPTTNTQHLFRVKASNSSTTLDIKVTDRFGNVYTETMTRPKAFTTDAYKTY